MSLLTGHGEQGSQASPEKFFTDASPPQGLSRGTAGQNGFRDGNVVIDLPRGRPTGAASFVANSQGPATICHQYVERPTKTKRSYLPAQNAKYTL